MVLKGFDIELWKDKETANWSLVRYPKGVVVLEVYFDNVDGLYISKKVDTGATVEDMLAEYDWLKEPI